MANFSVEWLSKSYYKDAALHSEVHSEMVEFTKGSRSQHSPSSPNNSCGYTLGSESEVGDDDSEGDTTRQQRRMRTKFSSEQIQKLEKSFSKHRYLGAMQRRKIAGNISETQVKTWFQNRRMKLKREVQERPDFLSVPAALLFQHPALSGQLPPGFYPRLLHNTAAPLHHVVMPPHFY